MSFGRTTLEVFRMMQVAPLWKQLIPRRCSGCRKRRFSAYERYCFGCVDTTLKRLDQETRHLVPPSYALAE